MIGPVPPGAEIVTICDFGSSPTAPAVRMLDSDGGTVMARTTAGILNMGGNVRARVVTAPDTDDFYTILWDNNNDNPTPDEVLWVSSTVIPTAPALQALSPGSVTGLTHVIRRNDTKPYLRRILTDSAGNAQDLTTATDVKFTMRDSGDLTMTAAAKVHADAVVIDDANGIVEYRWTAADTDTTTDSGGGGMGRVFAGEFEVTWADGTIQTFPGGAGQYIAITMPRDLDPGVDP